MTTLENVAPGPLPVINAICRECGLVEVIDDTVEWDQQQAEISPGALTAGLVMNFLTEGQPMYRLSEFFQNKDPENLFGENITAEDLYDRRFGWTLDKIADANSRTVLNSVIATALTTEGVDIGVIHGDTTSKSVHGEYDQDNWCDIGSVAQREDAVSHEIQEFTETISDQEMRCIVVKPSTIDGRSEKRIEKEITTAKKQLEDAIEELSDRVFACERDATQELETWLDEHQQEWFDIDADVAETEQQKSRDKPGRPANPVLEEYKQQITVEVIEIISLFGGRRGMCGS